MTLADPKLDFVACDVKDKWADDWQEVPYLDARRARRALAPEVDVAEVEYAIGAVKQADRRDLERWDRLELMHRYLRIRSSYEGVEETHFVGRVEEQAVTALAENRQQGFQRFTAYGFAHLFDRISIDRSWVETSAAGEVEPIDWLPTFNRRRSSGPELFGNRSDIDRGENVFAFRRYGDAGEVWDNELIVIYLLEHYAPPELNVTLGGQSSALEAIRTFHDPARWSSLWDALLTLIDRRQGLTLRVEVDDEANSVELIVGTVAKTTVTVGGASLVANARQEPIVLPSDPPFVHLVDAIPFVETALGKFDSIIVRGARIKVTAPFANKDGTIDPGWDTDLQDDYDAAQLQGGLVGDLGARSNDQVRDADAFDGVYTRFVVPRTFSGIVGDGVGDAAHNIAVTPLDNGAIDVDERGPWWIPGSRMLRETTFEVGVDYSQSTPTSANPAEQAPEFRPLLLLVKDDYDKGLRTSATERWVAVDSLADSIPGAKSVGVRPLDSDFGFQLRVSPRHYFAGDDFDPTGGGRAAPSKAVNFPEFDWRDLLAVATLEIDARQRIKVDLDDDAAGGGDAGAIKGEVTRTLTVTVDDAEYRYVTPGCPFDINADGTLKRAAVTVLRDDKARLESIAAYLKAWFERRRQAITFGIDRPRNWIDLGVLVTDLTTVAGSFTESINTVVSAVEIDFSDAPMTTTIETGWGAVDSLPEIAGG